MAVGVADAAQSEASVCQGAVCASASGARFNSTNGGGLPLTVAIAARDADGFELTRPGEAIAIVLRYRGLTVQTIPTVYSPALKRYIA